MTTKGKLFYVISTDQTIYFEEFRAENIEAAERIFSEMSLKKGVYALCMDGTSRVLVTREVKDQVSNKNRLESI